MEEMVAARRRNVRPLIDLLTNEPHRFDSRQAVRILELVAPHRVPLGLQGDPSEEALALHSSLSTGFPASDVDRIEMPRQPSGERPILTVNFLGLGGMGGPLPAQFTELVATRARRGDTASRDFLDIFNHRLVSLMMRCWRLFRPALQDTSPEETSIAFYLFALLGLATEGMRYTRGRHPRNRLDALDRSLLEFAGLLNQRPISLHAVERTLVKHFDLPVRVIPLRGAWLPLAPAQRTVIGRKGRNQVLGADAVLGGRVWDQHAGILITLGPIGFQKGLALLPTGAGYNQMAVLLWFVLGDTFDLRLQLAIRAEDVPASRLGKTGYMCLGWTAWLASCPRSSPGVATIRMPPPPARTRLSDA